jgi:hypothetical protein
MWLLNNLTPFTAERTWVRDENGAEVWIVAVKGSFLIEADGRQVAKSEQAEVLRVPVFRGEPERSSLFGECDLLHKKLHTDVLVEGDAVVPHESAAGFVDIRLRVANIDKTLRVYGERYISTAMGLSLSDPEPFYRMPIIYERSFGGTDQKDEDPRRHAWAPRNPVGVGFAVQKQHLEATLAPNVEYPSLPFRNWEIGREAGLGPIARHWSPRVQCAGTYDDRWDQARKPLLPADFNPMFYQCAPEDQQTSEFLRGGETVEVFNMTPEGHLSFPLPRITFDIETRFYDGTESRHEAVLHTLLLLPNKREFQMVWHSQLPCHHRVNKLEVTTVTLKRRINVSTDEIASGMWMAQE